MRGNSFFPSLGRLSVYFHYSWWPALEWPLTHWRNFFFNSLNSNIWILDLIIGKKRNDCGRMKLYSIRFSIKEDEAHPISQSHPLYFAPIFSSPIPKKKKIHKKILNHPHCQCVLGNISNAILMKIYFIIVTVHLGRVGAYSLKSQACRGRFLLQLLLLCLGQWGTQNLAWKSQKESSQTRYSTTLRVLVRQQGVC